MTAFMVFAFCLLFDLPFGWPAKTNGEEERVYFEKLHAARRMFRRQPNIKSEPVYDIVNVNGLLQAQYDNRDNTITVSQCIIATYTLEELSGVLAHEMAHAEFMSGGITDNRPHWQVGAAAEEFVERDAVLSALKTTLKHHNDFLRKQWPLFALFPLAITLYYELDASARNELEERIKKMEAAGKTGLNIKPSKRSVFHISHRISSAIVQKALSKILCLKRKYFKIKNALGQDRNIHPANTPD